MTCRQYGNLTVCSPNGYHWRSTRHCPTCERRRWFLVSDYVWYPTDSTCLGCGDTWSDGQRRWRPFKRGWRQDAINRARRHPYTRKADARTALLAEVDTYINPDTAA